MVDRNSKDHEQAVNQLYVNSYGELQDAALMSNAGITHADADEALTKLGKHIFTGTLDTQSYREWAQPLVVAYAQFNCMQRMHPTAIRRGVTSITSKCSDLGASKDTIDYLEDTAWTGVFLDLLRQHSPQPELIPRLRQRYDQWNLVEPNPSKRVKPVRRTPWLSKGTARLNVRLYGHGRTFALGWRTASERLRDNRDDTELSRIGAQDSLLGNPFDSRLFIEPLHGDDEEPGYLTQSDYLHRADG